MYAPRTRATGTITEWWALLAVLVLTLVARSQGHRVLAACKVVFLAMVADDFLGLHEHVGGVLGLERVLPGLTTMGAQGLGGLLFWAVTGSLLGLGLVVSYRSSHRAARSVSWTLLAVLFPPGARERRGRLPRRAVPRTARRRRG